MTLRRLIGPARRRRQGGFTLIELAVVIGIAGFLLGAFLVPLGNQIQLTRVREAERGLDEIRSALVGYAVANGSLPCPDNPADGISGNAVADCTGTATAAGILPWQTLGVRPTDPWGRVYYYEVTVEFTGRAQTGQTCGTADDVLGLCDGGTLRVDTRGDDPASGGAVESKSLEPLTISAPAVVVSVGPNGLGGLDINGSALAAVAAGSDEAENTDADANYVSRPPSLGNEDCDDADETKAFCEFDDLVIWISAPSLFEKLVSARVLP